MLSIFNLLECSLLVVNAIVILNEDRFLSKIGWGRNAWAQQTYGGQQMANPTVKSQILHMIHAIRTVMRVPLIFLNIIVICIKLIMG